MKTSKFRSSKINVEEARSYIQPVPNCFQNLNESIYRGNQQILIENWPGFLTPYNTEELYVSSVYLSLC